VNQPDSSEAEPSGPEGPGRERPDLAADLRVLGENLREALRAAWGSAERDRLQSDIERGLASLRETLGRTFEEGKQELGSRERMKRRMDEMRSRMAGVREDLRSTAVGDRVRGEIHELLTRLNDELRHSRERWTPRSGGGGAGDAL
jgi:predicted nuclease with TOPRIM domain